MKNRRNMASPRYMIAAFVALLAAIAQPSGAADFNFNIAGLELKRLSASVGTAGVICYVWNAVGSQTVGSGQVLFPTVSTPEGRQVVQGPFTVPVTASSAELKNQAGKWACFIALTSPAGLSTMNPSPCSDATRTYCYDKSKPNFASAGGTM